MAVKTPRYFEATKSITPNAAAYTAGDSIGGLLKFTLEGNIPSGAIINIVRFTDSGNIKPAGSLWLFNEAPTTVNDADAWTPSFADLQKRVAIVTPTWSSENSIGYADVEGINNIFFKAKAGQGLWGIFKTTGTPDWAADKTLSIAVGLLA